MLTFFHGWRRKVGCVTLAMAMAFMGLWVRSYSIKDTVRFRVADKTVYFFVSNRSWIYWQTVRESYPSQFTSPQSNPAAPGGLPQATLKPFHFVSAVDNSNYFKILTTEKFSVLLPQRFWFFVGMRMDVCGSPYWALILFLAFVSAYLLLIKPRVAKPKIVGENRL